MTRRDLAAVAGIALVSALLSGTGWVSRLDGLGIDALFWLRHQLTRSAGPSADAPVAVIAIDEETYRRPPFKDTPQAMWVPQQAKVAFPFEQVTRARIFDSLDISGFYGNSTKEP